MVAPPEEFNRANLTSLIGTKESVIEIGPFTNPAVKGRNVKYFDVLDKAGLLERARRIGYNFDNAVDIHYVSPVGDLAVVNDKFDVCLSSHCIEHQPDLIHHISQVERILKTGGRYLLIVPDKRYCFDHFIGESTIADILDAQGRKVHSLRSIVEHRALTTHNEPHRHWIGDHGAPAFTYSIDTVRSAILEHTEAAGAYVDVHAWQFTPSSFRMIFDLLLNLGLVKLKVERVYSTPHNLFEFCAVLSLNSQIVNT